MSNFWLTSWGVFSLVAILATSLINIYARFIDDSFLDRLIFSALALVTFAALLHVVRGEVPRGVGATIIVLMAIRQISAVIGKAYRWHMGKKKYAIPRRS